MADCIFAVIIISQESEVTGNGLHASPQSGSA